MKKAEIAKTESEKKNEQFTLAPLATTWACLEKTDTEFMWFTA